jgi:Flp pilus assembly protein TadB
MTMIDPKMMMPFFHSKMGIGMIVVMGLLEVSGALIIRRIVNIKV